MFLQAGQSASVQIQLFMKECLCVCILGVLVHGKNFGELCPSTVLLTWDKRISSVSTMLLSVKPPSLMHNKILWPLLPLKVMQRIGAQSLCH